MPDATSNHERGDRVDHAVSAGVSTQDRWLARFGTSFVIVGVVLAWQGFKAFQVDATGWRGCLELFASAASFAMGFVGIRARHRNLRAETENPAK